jgi:hypothetical protein
MMYIGVLQFSMEIPYSSSLKDKRSVVKSIKDKLRRNYNLSIAEVDDHESWNFATMGAVMAGTDVAYLNGAMDKVVDTLEEWRDATLSDHQIEIISPPA